jgi:hypothetical protein
VVIRNAQMSILDQCAKAGFTKQLAAYIRDRHGSTVVRFPHGEVPVSAIPDSKLEAMVQSGVDRAGVYRISWRSALASFVVTMFVVAPNFDDDIRIHELLTDVDIEPDYRMDSVSEQVTGDHWNMLRQTYDSHAWGVSEHG